MKDLQTVFNRMEEAKKKQKDLKRIYKDALDQATEYQEIKEELKSLREKKKRIETAVKEQFSQEIIQIEDLKIDIESDTEMLTDIALTMMSKGESIDITDADQNEYEPLFKVRFKKVA